MAMLADAQDPIRELKSAVSRESWRVWKIHCAAIGAYFSLVYPLFSLSNAPSFVQAWLDSLFTVFILMLPLTISFGVWRVFAFWMMNRLVLKRYPANVPVERLSAPVERVRLVITFVGMALIIPMMGMESLAPFKQLAQPVVTAMSPAYYFTAYAMRGLVKSWHTARQAT